MAATTSTEDAIQAKLLAWLSPAYPIGAFSYSHGLEMAVEDGAVTRRADLVAYVEAALLHGAGAVDAGLLALAWRAAAGGEDAALDEVTDLNNTGSILRTAAVFGVDGVIVTKDRSAPINGIVVRVSMAALPPLPNK
jgi:urease accessory protein UreF